MQKPSLRFALSIFAAIAPVIAATSGPTGDVVLVEAQCFQLRSAIDVNRIEAIGSPQTKASPSILHVSETEAERIRKLVLAAGGKLLGAPTAKTRMGEPAKVETTGEDRISLEVTPSGRSDILTLRFKLVVTNVEGTKKITRSATAMARVQESRALLVIENPREDRPGFLTILRAKRVK